MNGTYEDDADESREARLAKGVNPFGNSALPATQDGSGGLEVLKQRELAEVQGQMFLARQFPRNQVKATTAILAAFERPTLAAKAIYQYNRGGSDVTGPSIRAAEVIAREWGNINSGFREVERSPGRSVVEAYAWDCETNWRESRSFVVEHKRHTKKGSYALEDPRDIYEMLANEAQRRKRACILAMIPGDVIEAAMETAARSLKAKVNITPDLLKSIIEKFSAHGVTKEQLEGRIQRRFEAITPAQVVGLGSVLNSLDDGMSEVVDWFEIVQAAAPTGATRAEQLRERVGVTTPEPAATEPAGTGPTANEMLDAKVAEFVDAANGMSAPDVLAMVKRAAALRGIEDERALSELYKRASGKLAFTKTALPQIVRAILEIPIPVVEAPAPDLSGHKCQIHGTPVLECEEEACREKALTYIAMGGQPTLLDTAATA